MDDLTALAATYPLYYMIPGLRPGDRDLYFRVSSTGRYEGWDAEAKNWYHVAAQGGRDYFSKAIEGGDAWPVRLDELAAAGVKP